MVKEVAREAIPEFETLEEIADFWDAHSTADYEQLTQQVHFEVQLPNRHAQKSIILLPELSETIEAMARRRGVSVETLVNVWLTEKILESAA
jgi:hypothetical protein